MNIKQNTRIYNLVNEMLERGYTYPQEDLDIISSDNLKYISPIVQECLRTLILNDDFNEPFISVRLN